MKAVFSGLFFFLIVQVCAQDVESYGVFGGFNFPFTVDQGLQKDPRFYGKFTIRATPVGFSYGYDRVGHGVLFTPNYSQIGQQFIIKNSTGGEVGTRNVQMNYLSVPVALKLHINDMSFFRLSLIAAVAPSLLISGQETYTINTPSGASKLRYPKGVSVPTDPGYEIVYDGVYVPDMNKAVYVPKSKFNAFQLFGSVGLRSDFDLNDDWSLNFDGRANFGIFDTRKSAYLDQLKTPAGPADINGNPGAPDLYGQRREIFLSVSFGLSRIIQIKHSYKPKVTTHADNFRAANAKPPRSTSGVNGGMTKQKGGGKKKKKR
ncbi:MAG TPA: outer membrane beta-barrel protein [Cyclobacteriaceae bacterium]|nr:outer membrane beta-barrel protein [Cyclobacteriaceae bacterium]